MTKQIELTPIQASVVYGLILKGYNSLPDGFGKNALVILGKSQLRELETKLGYTITEKK